MVPYACTKSAALSLAEGLRNELTTIGMSKVRVSVVMPAYVATNIQHNEDARPESCKDIEAGSNEMDKFVWQKIDSDLKVLDATTGTISPELAGKRIIKQVKRGHFYIYTHRNFVKALIIEKANYMLFDRDTFEPGAFMTNYYARKVNED